MVSVLLKKRAQFCISRRHINCTADRITLVNDDILFSWEVDHWCYALFFLMSWELRRSTWISLILWAQKVLQHRMFVTTLAYVADHISWVISNTKHQQPIGLPPSTYGARGLPQLGQRLTFLSYPSVLNRKRVCSFFFHKPQQRSKTNVL